MKNFLKKLIYLDIKLINMKWKNLMNVINAIKNILNLDYCNLIKLKNIPFCKFKNLNQNNPN